jgi:hypothetical protein
MSIRAVGACARLCVPQSLPAIKDRCLDFESANFPPKGLTHDSLLALPVPVALFLCRRHPESLHHFLAYFDSLPARKTPPKLYMPYIIHRSHAIPIQWLQRHLLLVQDVRFASQFLNSIFSSALTIHNPLQTIQSQTKVDEKFRALVPATPAISWHEAWDCLTDLRASLKALTDLKMNLRLADYIGYQKTSSCERCSATYRRTGGSRS